MSRPLRIDLENGIYHVTSRGWERRVLIRDDRDRQQWFELLDRVVIRYGWRFFAWVLMDNHFHLFLQTPEANLSAGMHDLNSGYATSFNRRHRRSGEETGTERKRGQEKRRVKSAWTWECKSPTEKI